MLLLLNLYFILFLNVHCTLFLTLRFNLFIMSSIMAICMMFCRKFLIQMPRPLVHHGTDKKKLIDGVMCPAALFCCNAVTFWRGFVSFPPPCSIVSPAQSCNLLATNAWKLKSTSYCVGFFSSLLSKVYFYNQFA